MGISIFILISYVVYIIILLSTIIGAKKIYMHTKSAFQTFSFVLFIMIIGSWKLLFGYGMYFLEKETWPKQEITTSFNNVQGNIKCELRNKYFLTENDSSFAKKIFLNLYESNKNQIYSDRYRGVFCHYFNRETQRYEDGRMLDKKRINYLIIDSTQEIGILLKTSKEIYNLKNNQLIGLERKLAIKNIMYLPFFNFFKGAYWGYVNETIFSVDIESKIFKSNITKSRNQ